MDPVITKVLSADWRTLELTVTSSGVEKWQPLYYYY
jgi:hypothetical protein